MQGLRIKVKKALPDNFQEVLMINEMKFENEQIDIDLIKKLIYLYSVIMVNKDRYGVLRFP
jgi:hypothetical protein